MEFTIDDCLQHIYFKLKEGLQKHNPYSTSLSWASYDVALSKSVETFMSDMQIPNPDNPEIRTIGQDPQINRNIKASLENLFSEAFSQLTRRGILRYGQRYGGHYSVSQLRAVDEGFTITEYGKDWLQNHPISDLLPCGHGKLEEIFNKFQPIFGKDYFRRAREAVSCYFSGNYLACCVMCGAATESILLSAAFMKEDKDKVLRLYKTSSGRSRLEKFIFGQANQYIKDRYSKYTDLINYWCDESGHGDESEIDVNEAYIALLTLLRGAEFMRDHWGEITNSTTV